MNDPLMTVYEEFYNDHGLVDKNVQFITEDILLDEYLPDDNS